MDGPQFLQGVASQCRGHRLLCGGEGPGLDLLRAEAELERMATFMAA